MNHLRQAAYGLALLAFLSLSALQLPNRVLAQNTQQPQSVEVKINPQTFDQLVGQYQDPADPDFILSFFREGDKFYVRPTDQRKTEIFSASESSFFIKNANVQVDFIRDASGRAASTLLHANGKEYRYQRISDQPAQEAPVVPFTRTEAMIPMRDGVHLHTIILAPQTQSGPLPIIMDRTPYGVDEWNSESVNGAHRELVADGYVFVFQDIRGKFKSEGEFVMLRPPRDRRDAKSIDEGTDTYDTVEWLLKNVPNNNGRVGIFGVSYDGWLSTMALLEPHPALKAASPQAPVADFWMGDDFFHYGAFRESYGHEYAKALESSKTWQPVSFGKTDTFDWYLSLKTLSNLTTQLDGKLPTWNNFVAHPAYDSFWQQRAVKGYLTHASVPTLVVGGFWDQEDLYGALTTYQALQEHDRKHLVFLVEGPWNHGGWGGRGRRLADVDFGSSTGKYFRKNIQAPWFAYYLKGKGNLRQPEATVFQSGTNRWMTYDDWSPRKGMQQRELYLGEQRRLSFEKPSAKSSTEAFDQYVSDPSNPVPYRKRPVEGTYDPSGSQWYTWLAQDQRFLGERPDVLTWQTEPLAENVTITGSIIAHLFASTSGSDSDWVVKLIDVYPPANPSDQKMAGYQFMVAGEIFRGRYLKSFAQPQAIVPQQVNEYTVDLHANDYCFLKGHRIMVQVQSSWFPLYDRNPQTFVSNIFEAKESDFQTATQRIYRSSQYPSRLSVSVATNKGK